MLTTPMICLVIVCDLFLDEDTSLIDVLAGIAVLEVILKAEPFNPVK